VNRLWEEFWCHLILWVTMWAEFFSHCDSHYEKIVRKLWVEMNTLNETRWQVITFMEQSCKILNWLKTAFNEFLLNGALQKYIVPTCIVHCTLHSENLSIWNREKSLKRVWIHFPFLLHERIAKISRKIKSHDGF